MTDPDPGKGREPFTRPALTRHGSLKELTQGAGAKDVEKSSGQDFSTL